MKFQMSSAALFPPLLLLLTTLVAPTESSDAYSSPQFSTQPDNVIVAGGTSVAVLQCSVAGQPPPTVAWFREGGGEVATGGEERYSISGSTGELTISNVMPSDAGDYYCIASNAVGSVRSFSASLELAVFDDSGLLSDILTQTVSDREGLVLDCHVPISLPPVSIAWRLVGAGELDYDSGRLGVTLSGDLVISSVDLSTDTTNRFNCDASNDITEETFTTSYLLIGSGNMPLSIPTEFVATPTSQSVLAGDSAHFECFTTGTPVAEVSWTKDGSPLSSSSHLTLSQAQRILTISPVAEEDAGSYSCVATIPSTGSSVASEAATLTVIVPPMMVSSFSALAADVTEEVILVCEVVASDDGSNVEWEWRVNSSEVETSGNVLYDRSGLVSQLQIVSVMEEDGGVYQCVASLEVGGVTLGQTAANDRLSVVLTPPSLTSQPSSDLLVFKHTTISLPCTATGSPPPLFTWLIGDGITLDLENSRFSVPPVGSGDGTLTISQLVVADSSPYQCQVSNSAGSATSDTIQLRVLVRSEIVKTPGDLPGSVDNIFTALHGNLVSIPCQVSRDDGTIFVYVWYRDGVEVARSGMGTLDLSSVTEQDRGQYECVVEITASGVEGQPLEEHIGAITIGVGDPPTSPSPPTSPLITMVTNHTLTLHWTPPTFTGHLPLTGYVVELRLLGNQLCPQVEPEWTAHQMVSDPDSTGVTVSGLVPYQSYQVRLRAINSAYPSEPSPLNELQTLMDAPSSPPANVAAVANELRKISVSWEPPTDCLSYGGVITDYSVSYRISSESTFVTKMVGSNKTSLTLTSFTSQTTYTITVSAHTVEGAGPTSEPVEATTIECSAPATPTNLRADPVNTTAVNISWATPTDPGDLYIITWCHDNEDAIVVSGENSVLIPGLEPGQECVVMVTVNNICSSNDPVNITATPLENAGGSSDSVVSQQWFIAVVSVSGTLLIFGIPTIAIFLFLFICRRSEGKIYITSRRSGSSLSGASTAFTEYQQKHRGVARATGISVHSDPPPQRRTTDYADLTSYNSHLSSGTPSISSYQRQLSTEAANGGFPHSSSSHHDRHMTEHSHHNHTVQPDTSKHRHHRQQPPAEKFHHLGAENFPPGGGDDLRFNRGGHHRAPSPESTDSWSAAESLSYRGGVTDHVTGHVTDRGHSHHHTHQGGRWSGDAGKGSAGNVRRDWSAVPSNQLPPVQEHQIMDSAHHMWPSPRETVATSNDYPPKHSSQPLLSHDHSPSPPPLPTSLPPPLSSLPLPPQHTQSMDHILNHEPHHHRGMEPGNGNIRMGPVSQSHTQFQNHGDNPMAIQSVSTHPALGVSRYVPRSPSPEYAEPTTRENRESAKPEKERQQKLLALPPKSKAFGGSKSKQLSSAPSVLPPPPPQHELMEIARSSIQPRPVSAPKPPPPVQTRDFTRSTSDQPTRHPPPLSHPRSTSLEQEPARGVSEVHSRQPNNNLKEVLEQWRHQQEIQERERVPGGGGGTTHNGYPNPAGLLLSMPESSAPPSSVHSSRPSVSSQNDRWTTTHSPQPPQQPPQEGFNHIHNAETPIVKNAPPVFPRPPTNTHHHQITPADNRHHGAGSQSHAHHHAPPRKNHQLEGIYQSDPRKPRRKKGRVPGAVWKQMPMSSRIESSSSESDLSSGSELSTEYF